MILKWVFELMVPTVHTSHPTDMVTVVTVKLANDLRPYRLNNEVSLAEFFRTLIRLLLFFHKVANEAAKWERTSTTPSPYHWYIWLAVEDFKDPLWCIMYRIMFIVLSICYFRFFFSVPYWLFAWRCTSVQIMFHATCFADVAFILAYWPIVFDNNPRASLIKWLNTLLHPRKWLITAPLFLSVDSIKLIVVTFFIGPRIQLRQFLWLLSFLSSKMETRKLNLNLNRFWRFPISRRLFGFLPIF